MGKLSPLITQFRIFLLCYQSTVLLIEFLEAISLASKLCFLVLLKLKWNHIGIRL